MSIKWKDPRSGKYHIVSKSVADILTYLVDKKPGTFISWKEIGRAVDISMYDDAPSYPSRQMVWRSLNMLGLEYLSVKGSGFELIHKDTYREKFDFRTRRMCRAARRGSITATNTTRMLSKDLKPDDRSYIDNYQLMCDLAERQIRVKHELIESEFSNPLAFQL